MKNSAYLLLLVLFTFSCASKTETDTIALEDHSQHQAPEASPAASKSPKTEAMAVIGGNHIHIDYSSPSVRGRQIFGGLVGFGEVWSTGAHKATSIKFDKNVLIGGKETMGVYLKRFFPGIFAKFLTKAKVR